MVYIVFRNHIWKKKKKRREEEKGYKVNVKVDCTLTINETVTKSEVIVQELITSTHFIIVYKGNGTDHMNINLVNLAESGIMEGDEIGIFDGNVCVGSAQIVNLYSIAGGSSISIPVSAADVIGSKNGYSDGNSITVKLFRNGKEYPLTIEPLNNSQPAFEKGTSLFAQLALPTVLEGITIVGFADVKVYPNPFTDELNIMVYLPDDEFLELEIYDVLGRKVRELYKGNNPGKLTLSWNGEDYNGNRVVAGIYLMRANEFKAKVIRK